MLYRIVKRKRREQRARRVADEFAYALRAEPGSAFLVAVTAAAARVRAVHVEHVSRIRAERLGKLGLALRSSFGTAIGPTPLAIRIKEVSSEG